MIRAAWVLLSVAVLAAGTAGAEPTAVTAMTFNLRAAVLLDGPEQGWDERKEVAAEVLNAHRPDVVALQEACSFQVAYLLGQCPDYSAIGTLGLMGDLAFYIAPILYRTDRLELLEQGEFWLSDRPDQRASNDWGNPFPRVVLWGRFRHRESRAVFYFVGTHLSASHPPARAKGARLLVQRLAGMAHHHPLILGGDFNCLPDSRPYRILTSSSALLRDAFAAVTGDDAGHTFHAFSGSGFERIDYLFHCDRVEVEQLEVVRHHREGRYPSDHFPVLGRFRIPAGH